MKDETGRQFAIDGVARGIFSKHDFDERRGFFQKTANIVAMRTGNPFSSASLRLCVKKND